VDEKNLEGDLEDRIEHQDFDAEGQGLERMVETKLQKEIREEDFDFFQEDGKSEAKPDESVGDMEERQPIDLTNQIILKKKKLKMVFAEPRKLEKRDMGSNF